MNPINQQLLDQILARSQSPIQGPAVQGADAMTALPTTARDQVYGPEQPAAATAPGPDSGKPTFLSSLYHKAMGRDLNAEMAGAAGAGQAAAASGAAASPTQVAASQATNQAAGQAVAATPSPLYQKATAPAPELGMASGQAAYAAGRSPNVPAPLPLDPNVLKTGARLVR